VIQQLVVEQLLLAAAGGALGLALTMTLHRALPSVVPADFPRLQDVAMRLPVVAFAFGLTAAIGVTLGALPALHMRRLRLTQALGEGAGSIGGTPRRIRARWWIMTSQIAVASTLLIVALLVGRTFVAMIGQDRGFTAEHLLTARLSLPDSAFTPSSRIDAVETFVTRSGTLPGAPIVAATTGMPLSGSENLTGFKTPSLRPPVGAIIHMHAVRSVVTANYVRALGLRLVAGRDFRADDDSPSAPRVVLVNRRFAREYLTDQAIGDRIRNFMDDDQRGFEVIGIVDDMMRGSLTDRVQPEIYSLLRQSPKPSSGQDVVMRTAASAARLAAPLRQLVREIAPRATIDSIRTMDDRIQGSLARPRLYAVMLAAFAGSALVIAAVGLAGVLSYSVAQRSREIALRMALGAKPSQILAMVFSQGLTVTAVGIATGLAGAALAVRYIATLLYGVSTHDAVSFIAAPLTLTILALAACTAPAVRAARIDPLTKLRG
jgi:predicted permease